VVTGNVGVGKSLSVTDLGVFNAGINVTGLSNLTGNVGVGTSLTVTSAGVFSSGIKVSAHSDLATLSTSGNAGIGGTATITSLLKADSGLTVAAAAIFSGPIIANNTFTLGDNGDLGSINTSDWDISATGDLTGIGAITADGVLTLSADNAALSFTGTTPSLTSGSSVFGLFAQGNVGIGTTGLGGNGAYNLDVWGSARITGNTTLTGTLSTSGVFLGTDGTAAAPGLHALRRGTLPGCWKEHDGVG